MPLSGVGFEPTPPSGHQKPLVWKAFILESGALDRSAILTGKNWKDGSPSIRKGRHAAQKEQQWFEQHSHGYRRETTMAV
ncbi:hypothetical protein D4764_04G0004410 [Takifugu flavidus]|uniref:Uncharacterized protein n=1 Tax=Takifugu flavidus TaxID=433684 RepID=A0A5C6N2Y1_9TELE|nr:hypothetical protein D4764_04G0004410 [Takifugu flavidus]